MNDGRDLVFVVGCQRSGTTWLQLLLYQHPAVASTQETHLFDRYIVKLEEAWRRERSPGYVRRGGLSRTLQSDQAFDRLLRSPVDVVLGEILAMKPGASVVVEKTPDHVRHAETILRLYPAASFIHIVRDPRSVVCSLRDGSRSWAASWASADPVVSARHWKQTVTTGRAIQSMTDRYLEIRYEALMGAGERTLGEVFTWMGLDATEEFCGEALANCALSKLQSEDAGAATPWAETSDPEAFYRKGKAEGWRQELTLADLTKVEYIAGALMDELGYDRDRPARRSPPVSLFLRLIRERAVTAALALVARPVSIEFTRNVLRRLEDGANSKSQDRG